MKTAICYREEEQITKPYKEHYLNGINAVIKMREQEAQIKRDEWCRGIFSDQEEYRRQFCLMLGWPLTESGNRSVPKANEQVLTDQGAESGICRISRITIEVMEGFSVTGLLFCRDGRKKPLVIAQHGGLGTPEDVGNLYGKTWGYNHMVERMLDQDVHVFAPQLLWWDSHYEVPFNRERIDARLKRVGSSITALEVYALMRVMDYFETKEYVKCFGMIGLSYGGFYTLFTAAADTRIQAAVSSCYVNGKCRDTQCDWSWTQAAETFLDAEIACLVYPRFLCIEVSTRDNHVDITSARAELERLKRISESVGHEWLDCIVFDGVHEFNPDDGPICKLAEMLWK